MTPARIGTRALLAAVTLIALTSGCGEDPVYPFDDTACLTAIRSDDAVDAFEWFKDPVGGEKQLGNWTTEQGLAFAHELENRGVKQVFAVGVHKGATLQSAVGLVAVLPDDIARRRRVFELHAKQVRAAGYKPRADTGQKFLLFCWGSENAPDLR